jgi:hypothetical protein
MSRHRWVISLLLVLHLGALAFGAVPVPQSLAARFESPEDPADTDPIATRLKPVLDAAAAALSHTSLAIWNATHPISMIASVYLKALGLGQQWTMFGLPPRQDEYVRLRYYVATRDVPDRAAPSWSATELVYPATREDQVRLIRSFWYTSRDVSIFKSLSAFVTRLKAETDIRPDTRSSELPDNLVPIARYFARRFQRNHLTAQERILRTDVWYGTAATPPRGSQMEPGARDARLEILRTYYEGPIENHLPAPDYPPYFAVEREGDISWVLHYFEGS